MANALPFACIVYLSVLTSPPRRLSPLNINVLYSYDTNMDAYDDR